MLLLVIVGASIIALVGGGCAAVMLFGRRFVGRLRAHATFSEDAAAPIPVFSYASPDDPHLRELREKYSLEQVAGSGTDTERAIALMRWVHGLGKHASRPPCPERLDALYLIPLCREEKRRLNCWLFAAILNDVYLALGYPSRMVHLKPFREPPRESHFVTSIYLRDIQRWAWMDPDGRGFMVDEQGLPLGVQEVRQRLTDGRPLCINDDVDPAHAEWLPSWLPRRLLKYLYRWYLSKNCFRYRCSTRSEPDFESKASGRTYVEVVPDGYHPEWLAKAEVTPRGNTIAYTTNPRSFWAPPS
ncbi:MAG: transglutaminase-like domain-containing protein [Candidatus Bipolaricaulis sp.]|nr:transglutaminase-like domain-containing protein [Candidatus Bipolaricaulis sp.]